MCPKLASSTVPRLQHLGSKRLKIFLQLSAVLFHLTQHCPDPVQLKDIAQLSAVLIPRIPYRSKILATHCCPLHTDSTLSHTDQRYLQLSVVLIPLTQHYPIQIKDIFNSALSLSTDSTLPHTDQRYLQLSAVFFPLTQHCPIQLKDICN